MQQLKGGENTSCELNYNLRDDAALELVVVVELVTHHCSLLTGAGGDVTKTAQWDVDDGNLARHLTAVVALEARLAHAHTCSKRHASVRAHHSQRHRFA